MIYWSNNTRPVERCSIQFGPRMAVLGVLCPDVALVPAGLTEPGTPTSPQCALGGRQVRHEYYQDGNDDGSTGDLKSVRSPIVEQSEFGNNTQLAIDYDDARRIVGTSRGGNRSRSPLCI